jgi:D-tyrosyl-tRNA(Tyr) deacylase
MARAVIQRVHEARVEVAGVVVGAIERGLCCFIGVGRGDEEADLRAIADKIVGLRVFCDDDGKMNLSLREVGGAVLAVSQFTLYGDVRKGRRPSFGGAMDPALAEPAFERVVALLREHGVAVATGRFGAAMTVVAVGDGPVTILVDSRKAF